MSRAARVGVAVDPPLLADLLVFLLAGPNRFIRLASKLGRDGWDLAIVSPANTGSISAPSVIRLPGDHGYGGLGEVTTAAGSHPVAIQDVDAIERLVEAYLSA